MSFDIKVFIDEQQRVMFSDTRPVTEREKEAVPVLGSYDMLHGDRGVGELLAYATTTTGLKHFGKTLPAGSWDAASLPWQDTLFKDIPPDIDPITAAVTTTGLTSVLATAPDEDQPWLRDIMLAGGVYMLAQERRKMLEQLAEHAEDCRQHAETVKKLKYLSQMMRERHLS